MSSKVEQLGKYQIVRRLAAGGMAELYLGKQSGLEGFEKTVVIKRLHASLATRTDLVEMFLNEARIAARLNHPNCVQIYDLGQADGAYFIAMEYIHGPDMMALQRAAKKRKLPLPIPVACYILACVCRGLHHAHELADHSTGQKLALVHRDVSPHNVLVTYSGDVKLVDFGVAKANTLAAATQAGVLKGKFAYMSPEQCRGDPLDARSDIFAAGILLHELTTRRRLFRRNSDFATMRAVLEDPIPPPSTMAREMPRAIEAVIMRALSRDREDRYPDAQQMQLALEEAMRVNDWRVGPLEVGDYITQLFPDRSLPEEDSLGGTGSGSDEGSATFTPRLDPQPTNGSLLGGLARAPGESTPSFAEPLPSLGTDANDAEAATMIGRSVSSPPVPQPAMEVIVPRTPRAPAPEPRLGPPPGQPPTVLGGPVAVAAAPGTATAAAGSARVSSSWPVPAPLPARVPTPAPLPTRAPAPAPMTARVPAPLPAPVPIAPLPSPTFAPEDMLGTMQEELEDAGESTVMTSGPPPGLFGASSQPTPRSVAPSPQPAAFAPEQLAYDGALDDGDDDRDLIDDDERTVAGPAPRDLFAQDRSAANEPEELATTPLLTPAGPYYEDDTTPTVAAQEVLLDAAMLDRANDPARFAQPVPRVRTPAAFGPLGGDIATALNEVTALDEVAAHEVREGTDPVLPALGDDFGDEETVSAFDQSPQLASQPSQGNRPWPVAPSPGTAWPAPSPASAVPAPAAASPAAAQPFPPPAQPFPRPAQPFPPPGQPSPVWGATQPPPPRPPQPLPPPVMQPAASMQPAAAMPLAPPTRPAPAMQQPALASQPLVAPLHAARPAAAQARDAETAHAPTILATAMPAAFQPPAFQPPAPATQGGQQAVPTQAILLPDLEPRRSNTVGLLIGGLALVFVGLAVGLALLMTGGNRGKSAVANTISVTSNPSGAKVFLDGKEAFGTTPVVLTRVPVKQQLWLVAMKKGYQPARRQVLVPPGQQLRVDFSLVPLGGSQEGRAVLTIRSTPTGAEVYLDGTKRGETPLSLPQVTTEQKHVVVLRKDGFKDAVQDLQLKPDEQRTLELKLDAKPSAKPEKPTAPPKREGPVEVPRGRAAGFQRGPAKVP